MKLHRLRITAFGPFAGTEEVDFDDLASAGLFLLQGDTGAGKTTVLDAMCFALYGRLPGARATLGSSPRLRSDYADRGVEPSVELEFSVGSARYRVWRSPAWSRPKRRGEGTTSQNAKAYVEELRAGQWSSRATKPADVGAFLTGAQGVLGLELEQFTRVAMLPQGEFAQFLRSDSNERDALLSTLFDVSIYQNLQQVAVEHAKKLGEDVQDAERTRLEAVMRLSQVASEHAIGSEDHTESDPEVAGEPAPGHDLGQDAEITETEAADAHTTSWAEHLVEAAHSAVEVARARTAEARNTNRSATERVRTIEQHRADAAQRRTYQHRSAELEADRQAWTQRRTQLNEHRTAQAVARVLDQEESADQAHQAACHELAEAHGALPEHAPVADPPNALAWKILLEKDGTSTEKEERGGLLDVAHARIHAWEDAVGQGEEQAHEATRAEAQVENAAQNAARAEETLTQAQQRKTTADQRLKKAQTGVEDARQHYEEARLPETSSDTLTERLQALGQREAAAQQLVTAQEVHQSAQALADEAHRRDGQARQSELDLLEARHRDVVASLSKDLQPGSACAVCGSLEHPQPAPEAPEAPGEAEVEQAAQKRESAHQEYEQAQARAQQTYDAWANAREAAGGYSVAEVERQIEALKKERQQALDAEQAHRNAQAAFQAADQALAQAHKAKTDAEQAHHEAVENKSAADQAHTRAKQVLSTTLGVWTNAMELEDATRAWAQSVLRLSDAHRRALASQDMRARRRKAAEEALAEHELTREQARTQLMNPADAKTLEHEVAGRAKVEAEVATLGELEAVQRAQKRHRAGEPDPTEEELAQSQADQQQAAEALETAVGEESQAQGVHQQLSAEAQRLAQANEDLGPLGEEARTAREMADALNGRGGDNYRGIGLRAYVLAARLEAVVEAATHRLFTLSDSRFRIVHDDAKSGNRKAGLGVAVEDTWNNTVRPAATLSGGETFLVSLALALGLADVVQEESGGIAMETLFVDEGFGTLDQETLEKAMVGIDQLRRDGRMVGIVSHVEELRRQIPDQIQISKSRTGSSVKVVTNSQAGA